MSKKSVMTFFLLLFSLAFPALQADSLFTDSNTYVDPSIDSAEGVKGNLINDFTEIASLIERSFALTERDRELLRDHMRLLLSKLDQLQYKDFATYSRIASWYRDKVLSSGTSAQEQQTEIAWLREYREVTDQIRQLVQKVSSRAGEVTHDEVLRKQGLEQRRTALAGMMGWSSNPNSLMQFVSRHRDVLTKGAGAVGILALSFMMSKLWSNSGSNPSKSSSSRTTDVVVRSVPSDQSPVLHQQQPPQQHGPQPAPGTIIPGAPAPGAGAGNGNADPSKQKNRRVEVDLSSKTKKSKIQKVIDKPYNAEKITSTHKLLKAFTKVSKRFIKAGITQEDVQDYFPEEENRFRNSMSNVWFKFATTEQAYKQLIEVENLAVAMGLVEDDVDERILNELVEQERTKKKKYAAMLDDDILLVARKKYSGYKGLVWW